MSDCPLSSSDSEGSESPPVQKKFDAWNWHKITPDDGLQLYVNALRILGHQLAGALPDKVRRLAVTKLGEEPKESLIRGSFDCVVKERTLLLDCKSAFFIFYISSTIFYIYIISIYET